MVPDTKRVALVLIEAACNSFPLCVTEHVGVPDMDKPPRSDGSDIKNEKCWNAMKNHLRCFYVERRTLGPIAQGRCRDDEFFPPKKFGRPLPTSVQKTVPNTFV